MRTSIQTTEYFPLSDLPGSDYQGIDRKRMQHLAQYKNPLPDSLIKRMIKDHQQFLRNGGAGGSWTTIVIGGIVTGIYETVNVVPGKQANLEHIHLMDRCDLKGQLLAFINGCGLYAPELRAEDIDMSYSLLTDTYLPQANFRQAKLKRADFSRATLIAADFRNADLRYADFENCDLREADFRGANIQGARFPGANLRGAIR